MPVFKYDKQRINADGLDTCEFEKRVKKSGVMPCDNSTYETPFHRVDYYCPRGLSNSLIALGTEGVTVVPSEKPPQICIKLQRGHVGFRNLLEHCRTRRFSASNGYSYCSRGDCEHSITMPFQNKCLIELLHGYLRTMHIQHRLTLKGVITTGITLFRYRKPYSVMLDAFQAVGGATARQVIEVLEYFKYAYTRAQGGFTVRAPYWRWESDRLCHLLADFTSYYGLERAIGMSNFSMQASINPGATVAQSLVSIMNAHGSHEIHCRYIVSKSWLDALGVPGKELENPFSQQRNAICHMLWPQLLHQSLIYFKNTRKPHAAHCIAMGYGGSFDQMHFASLVVDTQFTLKHAQSILKNLNHVKCTHYTISSGYDNYTIYRGAERIGLIKAVTVRTRECDSRQIATVIEFSID